MQYETLMLVAKRIDSNDLEMEILPQNAIQFFYQFHKSHIFCAIWHPIYVYGECAGRAFFQLIVCHKIPSVCEADRPLRVNHPPDEAIMEIPLVK